ncbi:MAG: YbaK/EbsC family protein [Cellulomonas sp.]|nr:YbaK/EbsC family protein [Cellulomonas sp.]
MSEERALAAVEASGITYRVVRHGHVSSLAEAAAARGIEPSALLKSIVVRRADDDFLFVLLPGDREISWPKLRALLGVKRMSMPDADTALAVTGYARGTITPFGSTRTWPVVVDASAVGHEISLGAGASGVGIVAQADDVVRALGAQVADIT